MIIYIYIYIYIYHSSWNFGKFFFANCAGYCAGNFVDCAAIARNLQRIAGIVLSPKFCVILKKFRTNFKVLHGQDPKN